MSSLLEAKNISKTLGEKKIFNEFSMNVKKNEILGVVGHNGAGKTTLFKLILEMYFPDKGTISINEEKFDLKDDVGYLPEQRGLYNRTDIYSQLLAFGYLKGRKKKELIETIDFWLEYFKIHNLRKELLGNLSKGNQQKVQFIVSVLNKPKLLILDEPFSGLDPINVDLFISAIKTVRDNGTTIIYSSHKMDSIEHLSDRLLFIKKGELIHFDTINNIQARYNSVLKIENPSINSELLESLNLKFDIKDTLYEIELNTEGDENVLLDRIDSSLTKTFIIEKPTVEKIFKSINQEEEIDDK
ncbi:ATP-binding cassette domain-containing protein [Shouchella sp. 1P09AA]|uniref:ABC transporter ATP-binding protein n=1 Tax=unclassified Shouchella TaxID=2893065 RepID=UPI0039A365A5